jgi:hypothetical protein
MKGAMLYYYAILIAIILIFAYINSLTKVEESFTPKIREVYRPIVRKTRIVGEGFYNKSSSDISNLFRKFGIL